MYNSSINTYKLGTVGWVETRNTCTSMEKSTIHVIEHLFSFLFPDRLLFICTYTLTQALIHV